MIERLTGTQDADKDTSAIAAAIKRLSLHPSGRDQGVLELEGAFAINAPLAMDTGKRRVMLRGVDDAALLWAGQQTDSYLLRLAGYGRVASDVLTGLRLYCNGLCRGLEVDSQPYGGAGQVYVCDARGIGVRVANCWGAKFGRIIIAGTNGVAFESERNNGTTFEMIQVHGGEGTQWPEEVPGNRVAAVYVHDQSNTTIGQLFIERAKYKKKPLICLANSALQRINTLWLEGNEYEKAIYGYGSGAHYTLGQVSGNTL